MMKRILPLLLALAMITTAAAEAPSDADIFARFTYSEKPVAVVLVTEDQEIIDYTPTSDNDPREEGERFVEVLFNVQDNPFTSDEMLNLGKGASVTNAQGNSYTTTVYTGISVKFGADGLSLSDEQAQFGLIFHVPEKDAIDTLTLHIEGVEDPIALSVFGEANFPAETEAPSEEPEATEAPAE